MSKSIYKEVLEEIDLEFDAWDRTEHLELFEKVEYALEQAKKQERLLELYKELSNYVDEQTYAHELPNITRLKILIEDLEK